MIIMHFNGLDMYLVGELNEKIHSKVAKTYGVSEEELVFSASDSFVFFKGHEQTSFNLVIKVECPVKYKQFEEKVAELLLEETKNYSVHTRLLFNYYQESNYYERINENYPEYIVADTDVTLDEDEYDEDKEYSDDEIYLGNVFKDNSKLDGEDNNDEPRKPFVLNDFFKK
jgi:hypothetical protein